jgi:pimeloyl-ACP methyl ester carboxylesterase
MRTLLGNAGKYYFIFLSGLYLSLPLNSKSQSLISEDRFLSVNGIPQWITIHGEKSKPVILFLHGGPGSTMSPYSENVYHAWEKDFIIVQWDQRGSGKTFGNGAPSDLDADFLKANPLTVKQMTADGITLTEYLIKYLRKEKLILFGSSWGSVLGISMASLRPDLYYAYVGHAQIVDPVENFPVIYEKVRNMSREENDQESLEILRRLGSPPYDTARNYGQLLRIVKKFEKKHAVAAPESFWNPAPAYDNAKDEKDRADGDDYSFVNYTGDKRLGIQSMMDTIHFSKTNLVFGINIFILQGQEDILTSKETTSSYFDQIRAPKKKYILIPGAAHGFKQSVVDVQHQVMKEIAAGIK